MVQPLDAVRIERVSKSFESQRVLRDISLVVHSGEIISLLGPSGCGKTTLLRLIAGLELPDTGTISISGVDVTLTPPHKRAVNTVFQSYALFPHLSVFENVAFGLRMKRLPDQEITQRVHRVLELVHIEGLSARAITQLSGGQQQRVALARAIVNEPHVVLLDESLAALDRNLRRTLQEELRNLRQRIGSTFIFVTHDQEEAFALSDRIAVMCAGEIQQLGTPSEIYLSPATQFVSNFVGDCNLVQGTIQSRTIEHTEVTSPLGVIKARTSDDSLRSGERVVVMFRPERVVFNPATQQHGEIANRFSAEIQDVRFSGAFTRIAVRSGSSELVAMLPAHEACMIAGQSITVHLPIDCIRVMRER